MEKFQAVEGTSGRPDGVTAVGTPMPILQPHAGRAFGATAPGVEVRRGDTVLSVCRNNGFMVGAEYYVDVDTHDTGERRKGYATLAALMLIRHGLDRGEMPLWETTLSNAPPHCRKARL